MRVLVAIICALSLMACEKKKESDAHNSSEGVKHVTCFSGGKVVYEGDWEFHGGFTQHYSDVKTNIKFYIRDSNDCFMSSAPFYKANQ